MKFGSKGPSPTAKISEYCDKQMAKGAAQETFCAKDKEEGKQ